MATQPDYDRPDSEGIQKGSYGRQLNDFRNLVKVVRKALQEKKSTELLAHITKNKCSLISADISQLTEAKKRNDFNMFFTILEKYWCFLDYSLLESLYKKFLSSWWKKNETLEKYQTSIIEAQVEYCEIDFGKSELLCNGSTHLWVILRFKLLMETKNLKVFKEIKGSIASIFSVHPTCTILDKIKIEPDCIELVAMFPRMQSPIVLTEDCKEKLANMAPVPVVSIEILEDQGYKTLYDVSPATFMVQRACSKESVEIKDTYFKRRQLKLSNGATPDPAIPLVTYDQDKSEFVANKDAISLLKTTSSKSVAVLSICGPLRTGKSYFMSQILQADIFQVSDSLDACTKGIWMSTKVLETDSMIVFLLDTEGMDAPQAGEFQDVIKFVILTTLLSSYLIYNNKEGLTSPAVEKLSCFGEISQKLLSQKETFNLKQYYPDFLWLLRDNNLIPMDSNNRRISCTEYVNTKIFVASNSDTKRDAKVKMIQSVFPTIECIQIPHPGDENISHSSEQFNQAIKTTINHIFEKIWPKYGLNKSQPLTGSMLASLLVHYVNALNDYGDKLLLEESYIKAARYELSEEIQHLSKEYSNSMEKKVTFPIEEGNLEVLLSAHKSLLEDAMTKWSEFAANVSEEPAEQPSLFNYHWCEFKARIQLLWKKIHQILPPSKPPLAENSVQMQTLQAFQDNIIQVKDDRIGNCKLQVYTQKNNLISEKVCENCFQELYKRQVQSEICLKNLKADYYDQAIGPARDRVFEVFFFSIPEAPANVTVTGSTHNSIKLSWNKPVASMAKVSQYQTQCIYNGKEVFCKTEFYPSKHECEIVDLKPNRKYSVRIRGTNEFGVGEYCNLLTCKTAIHKPESPDTPQISVKSPTEVELKINALPTEKKNGSNITHIIVGKKRDNSEDWIETDHCVDADEKDYYTINVNVTCSPKDSRVFFRIRMKNEAGVSEPSKKVELSCEDMIPGPPHNVELVASVRSIQIKWEPPQCNAKSAKYYSILFKELQGGTWIPAVDRHTECSFTIDNLTPNTKYAIKIQSYNQREKGLNTEVEAKTTIQKPESPDTPQISVKSPKEAELKINALPEEKKNGSNITHIIVGKKGDNSEEWIETHHCVDPVEKDYYTINVDVTCSPKDSRVLFRIKMKNEAGVSEPSKKVELSCEDMIPGSPHNVTLVASERSIQLKWEPPKCNAKSAKYYSISYKKSQEGQDTLTTVKDRHTVCSFTIGSLIPNSEYTIKIQSYSQREFGLDTEVKATTLKDRPNKPHKPSLKVISSTQAELSFQKPTRQDANGSPITHVIVIRSLLNEHTNAYEEKFEFNSNDVGSLKYTVNLPSIDRSIEIMFRIQYENEKGRSDHSEETNLQLENMIPGKVQELDAPQNMRSCNSINLTWKLPEISPFLANIFEIQFRKSTCSGALWQPREVKRCDIFDQDIIVSVKILDLEVCTSYDFCVKSKNHSQVLKAECLELKDIKTLASEPPKPKKPEITTQSNKFSLCIALPPIELSGEEVNKVHICHYKHDLTHFKTVSYEVNAIPENRHFVINELEVNTDDSAYVSVKLENKIGTSKEESELAGISADNVKPDKPMNFKAVSVNVRSIKLSWNAPSINGNAAECYEISYTTVSKNEYKIIKHNQVSLGNQNGRLGYEAVIGGLSAFTDYSFRICAQNRLLVCGKYTSIEVTTEKSVPEKPSKPDYIQINKKQPERASIKLPRLSKEAMNGSDINEIVIEYSKDSTHWEKLEHSLLPMDNTEQGILNMPNLEDVEENFNHLIFRTVVKNELGSSEPSDLFYLSVEHLLPGAPVNVTATCTTHSLTVNWEKPIFNNTLTNGYRVEFAKQGEGEVNHVECKNTKTAIDITGLKSNTYYIIRICAIHDSMRGPFIEIEKSTLQAFPTAPLNLRADKVAENAIKVRWSKPSTFAEEVLYYRVETIYNNKVSVTRNTKGYSSVFSSLESSTSYVFRVTSVNTDNKVNPNGATAEETITTKYGKHKRRGLQVAAGLVTFGLGSVAIGYAQAPDEDIYPTDEEYEVDD